MATILYEHTAGWLLRPGDAEPGLLVARGLHRPDCRHEWVALHVNPIGSRRLDADIPSEWNEPLLPIRSVPRKPLQRFTKHNLEFRERFSELGESAERCCDSRHCRRHQERGPQPPHDHSTQLLRQRITG